jgi:type I restriction enzyme S subunit
VVSGVAQLQVPDGYQQTEVGVIPSDWNMVSYDENFSIISGVGFNKSEYSQSGLKLLRIDNVSYGVITWDSIAYLPKSYSNRYQSLILKRKDILLALNRPITNGKLKMAFVKDDDLPSILYQRVGKIIFLNDRVDKVYAFYILTKFIKQFVEQTAVGTDQPFISTTKLKKCKIPIPSDSGEQTAIANALSDVDALITSLEKLIAKKRAIKTAAMQQLLTGKKRLPPFDQSHIGYKQTELGEIPEDWEIVGLGRLFEPKLNRKRVSSQDDVTFVGMQDVTETAKINNMHKVKYSEVKSGFTYFERNDVLVAKITPCFENGKGGYADVIDTQVGFGSTEFHVLRARDDVDSKYLFYFTNTVRFRSELESEMVGSAGHRRVPFSSVQKFRVAVTLDKEEQKAIANTLSDMDFEIDALASRLNKTQQLKQGMMQELLTGRTRLL